MQKFKVVLLVLLLCSMGTSVFNSCSDSTSSGGNSSIVGSWVLTKVTMISDEFTLEYNSDEIDLSITLVINEDGTYTSQTIDDGVITNANGTWCMQDDCISMEENGIVTECNYTCSSSILRLRFEQEKNDETTILIQEFIRQ